MQSLSKHRSLELGNRTSFKAPELHALSLSDPELRNNEPWEQVSDLRGLEGAASYSKANQRTRL